jgi:hypothetical protein
MRRAFVALVVVAAACAPAEDAQGPITLRTQVGDTTIVRSMAPGPWGERAGMVEELRIGVLEGAEEYQFGLINEIAIDDSGGIYVFDGQVPALRYYDSSGAYIRTIGSEGQGPGEYLDASLGIVIRSDGRVVMRDPRNMRMNVYNPDGSHSDSWRVNSGLYTGNATASDTADHLFLKILTGSPEPDKPWPVALLHLDDEGQIVDTLVPPSLPNEPEGPGGRLMPSKQWVYSPLGGFVAGVSNTYAINHFRNDGTVLRVERDLQPVQLDPEEKAELEAVNDWLWEQQGQFMTSELPPIPDQKPLFGSIMVGEDGRTWVRRHVAAVKDTTIEVPDASDPDARPVVTWIEPTIYDVFEPGGEWLGSVEAPRRTSLRVLRGDQAWGVRRGEFNENYVVRFRIEPSVQGG